MKCDYDETLLLFRYLTMATVISHGFFTSGSHVRYHYLTLVCVYAHYLHDITLYVIYTSSYYTVTSDCRYYYCVNVLMGPTYIVETLQIDVLKLNALIIHNYRIIYNLSDVCITYTIIKYIFISLFINCNSDHDATHAHMLQ